MADMRNIIVVPYDPRWPAMAAQEMAAIRDILGDALLAIHHIGSTAVPGLSAKPIIDLLPVVRKIEQVDDFNAAMAEMGYVARGENGIAARRYFCKGPDDARSHHVHIFADGHPDIARHLNFRDYLREHPDVAVRYAQIKLRLAAQYRNDITRYVNGKGPFIREIEERAERQRSAGNAERTTDGD